MKSIKYATWGILTLVMGIAAAHSQVTPNLNLNVPAIGSTGYAPKINANFISLDSYLSGGSVLPAVSVNSLVLGGTSAATTTTGTGALVRATSPSVSGGTFTNLTLVTPVLGVAAGTSLLLDNGGGAALTLNSNVSGGSPILRFNRSGIPRIEIFLDSLDGYRISNPNGVQFQVSVAAPLAIGSNLQITDSGALSIGTGITNAHGVQHARFGASCVTTGGTRCFSSFTWPVAPGDTSYTAACNGTSFASGHPVIDATVLGTSAIQIGIASLDGTNSGYDGINCIYMHD